MKKIIVALLLMVAFKASGQQLDCSDFNAGWGLDCDGSNATKVDSTKVPTMFMISGFVNKVDTIYRTIGKDSIQYKINGRYHAILDSAGAGTVTTAVDTIYRTLGKDSIQFKISGRYHAILDSAGGTGTVTSVGSGYGLSGGTITTTGTLVVDSATLSGKYVLRNDTNNIVYPYKSNPKNYLTIAVTSVGSGYGLSGGTITTTGTLVADTACSTCPASKTYVNNSISGLGSGTVTNVATASPVTGGPITTTGTIGVDTTTILATQYYISRQGFGTGSVTSVGSGYGLSGGAITTTGTLVADTISGTGLVSKDRLSNAIAGFGAGTVTSVATGLGLSGGTITTTGTLIVDTASASILSRQRAANTYFPLSSVGSMAYADSVTFHGNANIVTLGTIGTGVWHGTAIDSTYLANVVSKLKNGIDINVTNSGGKAWIVDADTTSGITKLATQGYVTRLGYGTGTVTSVATGYGLSGGTITTTGTLVADTTSGTGLVSKGRLSNAIAGFGSGTVTSVATGLGLSGGTITTTGTLIVDTASTSILSRQRAANTYALIGSGGMAIGGTITSATANSVLYAGTNGFLQQSNSTFNFDSTNNYHGIGLASPQFRIHTDAAVPIEFGAGVDAPNISGGVEENLVLRSQQFGSTWVLTGGGPPTLSTDNTISPDGATTADRLNGRNAADSIIQTITNSTTGNYCFSVWMKSAKANSANATIVLSMFSNAQTPAGTSFTVGTQWRRYYVVSNLSSAHASKYPTVRCNTDSVYLWGAQVNAGAYAMPYTVTAGAIVTSGSRFEAHIGGGAGAGLIIDNTGAGTFLAGVTATTGTFSGAVGTGALTSTTGTFSSSASVLNNSTSANLFNINGSGNYRVTNGGSTFSAQIGWFPNSTTASGALGWIWDVTQNGHCYTAGNGARQIVRASEQIVNLVNTAGQESGDFAIYTKPGASSIAERMRIDSVGHVGIGVTAPGAFLELAAGSTAAKTAPLKLNSGALMTTPVNGAVQYLDTNLYVSSATYNYTIQKALVGSATLDFANLVAIGCEDLTITVTGAQLSEPVILGVPNASVVNNSSYSAWVSAANTVTVRFCALVSGDPASGSFKVSVIKP